jgi:hypothetical protein
LALCFLAAANASHATYKYAWGVNDADSGVYANAEERRSGDKTSGKYTVVEPDGSLREVVYYVNGDSGFIVSYFLRFC